MANYSEYKVEVIQDGGCSTFFFGNGNIPTKKLESVLNNYAKNDWSLVFQVIERRRFLLFWSRQAVILTFGR